MKNKNVFTMDTMSNVKSVETLRSRLRGIMLQPGDEQYTEASKAWNLNAQQRPSFVVLAAGAGDIIAAVQFANESNLGVGVMATGHGVGMPCDGGVLINTSRMRGVTVDPIAQTAIVEAGARWKDVVPAAHQHGLAGLGGSASHVGVVGYTLGGGFGFLGRKYGFNSMSVTAADIVTADGKLIRVSPDESPELFWAVNGSVGNFGVITSLEFRLYPLTTVYGGAVFYPVENAREALNLFNRWSATIPDEITAAFAFMNVPPVPFVPEVLRGRSVVAIKGCYCGENSSLGEELFKTVRKELGESIMDTFKIMPVTEMDTISNDPVDPMGVLQYGSLLSGLSGEAVDALMKVAGAGSGSPLAIVELRRLGGALQRNSQSINMLGNGSAQFSLNGIGGTFTPEMFEKVSTHLRLLADTMKPFQTGETYINFLELSPGVDSVKCAYTAKDWERLVALKKQYDPANIFRFNRNIPPK